jgi:hypothetical protein
MNETPSIVEIKSLEKEVQMLLAQYNDTQANYIAQAQKGFSQTNNTNLQLMKEINNKIISLLSIIKYKISIIYPKGISNQNVVRMNNQSLLDISNKLHAEQKEIQKSIDEYNDLDGQNKHLTLQTKSTYYMYMFYLIISIIFGLYVLKIYTVDYGYDTIDTIILILAIILLVYHLFPSFINYGTNSVQYIIRSITSMFYLF